MPYFKIKSGGPSKQSPTTEIITDQAVTALRGTATAAATGGIGDAPGTPIVSIASLQVDPVTAVLPAGETVEFTIENTNTGESALVSYTATANTAAVALTAALIPVVRAAMASLGASTVTAQGSRRMSAAFTLPTDEYYRAFRIAPRVGSGTNGESCCNFGAGATAGQININYDNTATYVAPGVNHSATVTPTTGVVANRVGTTGVFYGTTGLSYDDLQQILVDVKASTTHSWQVVTDPHTGRETTIVTY